MSDKVDIALYAIWHLGQNNIGVPERAVVMAKPITCAADIKRYRSCNELITRRMLESDILKYLEYYNGTFNVKIEL